MTDLEKYKQLFDETNVGYVVKHLKNSFGFDTETNEENVDIIRIEADFSVFGKEFVNGGYVGFTCGLLFNESGKLIKFNIFE